MRSFFAGVYEQHLDVQLEQDYLDSTCILGSYFYLQAGKHRKTFDPHKCKDFILDSGAFTMLFGNGMDGSTNWKEYIRGYAHFIKEYGIKKYIELDLDAIIGYDRVLQYRAMLEDLVGYPCIPVYHPSRTKEQFLNDSVGHPYVSFGSDNGDYADKTLVDVANSVKEMGCKIHFLGVANPIPIYEAGITIDSCDSTSWVMACKFGRRAIFDKSTKKFKMVKVGRTEQYRPYYRERWYNFWQWWRFAQWAYRDLDILWEEDKNSPIYKQEDWTPAEVDNYVMNILVDRKYND